jgi:hypothetical protein
MSEYIATDVFNKNLICQPYQPGEIENGVPNTTPPTSCIQSNQGGDGQFFVSGTTINPAQPVVGLIFTEDYDVSVVNIAGNDWLQLNSAFTAPTFSAFTMSAQATTLEIGSTLNGGNRTFTWATTTPANITPNSITIRDMVTATNLATGLANDGSEVVNIGANIVYTNLTTHTWRISATNLLSATFTRNYAVNWQYRLYNGTSIEETLVEADVIALTTTGLFPNTARTYSFGAGGYKWFAFPQDYPIPTGFINTANSLPVAMTNGVIPHQIITITNAFGVTKSYRLYRTLNILGGSINIQVTT